MTNPYDPSGGYPGGQQPGYGGQPDYGQQPGYGAPQQPAYGAQQPAYGAPAPASPPYGGGYGQPGGYPNSALKPANIGMRFVARLLDGLIVGCPMGIIAFLIGGAVGMGAVADPNSAAALSLGSQLLVTFIVYAGWFLYEMLMLGAKGQTLGKMIVGLKVVNQQTGQVPGMGPAAIRALVYPFLIFVPCLGYLWALLCGLSPLFDSKSGYQQGFQDKAAKTIVISTK